MRDERRYFVYIMTNPSRTLYTGMTNSLRRRVHEHKLKLTPGFTAKYNITRLVYFESFEDVRNSIEREKQIKAWTRAKRIALVESTNPKWDDLSREWDSAANLSFRAQDGVKIRPVRIPQEGLVFPSEARDLGSCLQRNR